MIRVSLLINGGMMLELRVFWYDVFRYKIISDWNRVQELRSQGYYVQVKPIHPPDSPINPDRNSLPSVEPVLYS